MTDGVPRAAIQVDASIPTGEMHTGGVFLIRETNDEGIGFAITARKIRVPTTEAAERLEAKLTSEGWECRRYST